MDAGLRLNGVWALQNLLFMADSRVKAGVMAACPWTHLVSLLEDPEQAVQVLSLAFVRHLVLWLPS